MSAERLRDLLGQVHAELEATDTIDDEGRELIAQTMHDLARALERGSGARPPHEESLRGRLEEAARRFETEHPRLVATLQQIADTLSGAGI